MKKMYFIALLFIALLLVKYTHPAEMDEMEFVNSGDGDTYTTQIIDESSSDMDEQDNDDADTIDDEDINDEDDD